MKKILILYYSRTGNTERMAHAVAEGAKSNDVEVEVSFHVDAGSLESFDAIVVGDGEQINIADLIVIRWAEYLTAS